jgi:ABC-type dipeptide/oligopeptide/nickel transport system ATPase component
VIYVKLVEIKNLSISFRTLRGHFRALKNISLNIEEKQVMGLVGETGSGKTTIGLSIIKLLPPNALIEHGEILFEDKNILDYNEKMMRELRGSKISIIFQEPKISLNPVLSIGRQLTEIPEEHLGVSRKEAYEMSKEMLKKVGLADPERIMRSYPHQLSGGMSQRIMIAMAMMLKPKLLIADEPTSALDVTIQAQVIELMRKLVRETGSSVLFITHDLSLAAEFANEITVVYKGEIVEQGSVEKIFYEPEHWYTRELLNAIPKIGCRDQISVLIENER